MYITEYEVDVLNGIAYHEMNATNGARPECAGDVLMWCWPDQFSSKLTVPQVKGVLSSLVKKGLISISDYGPGEDNTIQFTVAGFKAFESVDRAYTYDGSE